MNHVPFIIIRRVVASVQSSASIKILYTELQFLTKSALWLSCLLDNTSSSFVVPLARFLIPIFQSFPGPHDGVMQFPLQEVLGR